VAITLSATALATREEYYAWLGQTPDEITPEGQLEMMLNAASLAVENYCNRKFVTPQTAGVDTAITEVFSGVGSIGYYTKQRPIKVVSAIHYWSADAWVAIPASWGYTYYTDQSGYIYYTEGDTFYRGTNNWRVSYTYGYAQADVPADVKGVTIQLVRREILKADKLEGLESQSFGEASTRYNLGSYRLTPDMREILDQYRTVAL